jgi:hypothetical protein
MGFFVARQARILSCGERDKKVHVFAEQKKAFIRIASPLIIAQEKLLFS